MAEARTATRQASDDTLPFRAGAGRARREWAVTSNDGIPDRNHKQYVSLAPAPKRQRLASARRSRLATARTIRKIRKIRRSAADGTHRWGPDTRGPSWRAIRSRIAPWVTPQGLPVDQDQAPMRHSRKTTAAPVRHRVRTGR